MRAWPCRATLGIAKELRVRYPQFDLILTLFIDRRL
jgi:hypothetical protein